MAKKLFRLPEGRYDPTFLKALACAVHLEKLEPAELEWWFENGWNQYKIGNELYERVK